MVSVSIFLHPDKNDRSFLFMIPIYPLFVKQHIQLPITVLNHPMSSPPIDRAAMQNNQREL
jgi:hypothetical protein